MQAALDSAGCPANTSVPGVATGNATGNSTVCARFDTVADTLSSLLDILVAAAVAGEDPVALSATQVRATVQRVLGLADSDPALVPLTNQLVELVNDPGMLCGLVTELGGRLTRWPLWRSCSSHPAWRVAGLERQAGRQSRELGPLAHTVPSAARPGRQRKQQHTA